MVGSETQCPSRDVLQNFVFNGESLWGLGVFISPPVYNIYCHFPVLVLLNVEWLTGQAMARTKVSRSTGKMGIRQAVVSMGHQLLCGCRRGQIAQSGGYHVHGVLVAYVIRSKYVTDIFKARRLLFGAKRVSLFTLTMNQAAWTAASNGSKQFKLLTEAQYADGLHRTRGIIQLWGYQHGLALLGSVVYRGHCLQTAVLRCGGVAGLLDESQFRTWVRANASSSSSEEAWIKYCRSVLRLEGAVVVCEFGMLWPPQCASDVLRLRQHIRM